MNYRMRLITTVILIVMLSFLPKEIKADICAQTINLYGPWYAPSLGKRTARLKKYLVSNSCDIIFFQEVWLNDHRIKLTNILESLGYSVFHFDKIAADGKKYGLMTAVRGKILSSRFESFDRNYAGVLDVIRKTFNVGKGFGLLEIIPERSQDKLTVVNLHLHHANPKIRLLQTEQLLNFLNSLDSPRRQPVIIGGDFNFEPKSSPFQKIVKKYRYANFEGCTYCSENKYSLSFSDKKIDHLFYSTELNISSFKVSIEPKDVSDHYGLKVIFNTK